MIFIVDCFITSCTMYYNIMCKENNYWPKKPTEINIHDIS